MDNQNNTFKSEAEIMETIAAVTPVESSADDAPLIQPVKPEPVAPPVPEKKEVNVIAIVLGVIAGIFAIVAIVFLVKYFTEKPKCETETVVQEPSEAEKEAITTNVMARDYKEVYDLVSELAAKDNKRHLYNRDNGFLMYTAGDTGVYVEMKYALGGKMISSFDSLDSDMVAVGADLEAVGFKNIGVMPFVGSAGPEIHGYLNEETKTVCNVYESQEQLSGGAQEYVDFSCSKTSWAWLTEDELKLIGELATAYRDKNGTDVIIAMSGWNSPIKNSKYEPYQTIMVGIGGGYALFYRVNPESEWQYFAGGQSYLECSEYNTDDLKKAFVGEVCYNGNEMSTVQL